MKLTRIVAAALAVLLVGTAGAVAAPGNAPEDAGPSAQDGGPPVDMPEPVPDFVESIHEQIWAFLNGSIENLGEAVSGVTPGGDEGSTPTPTPA